MSRYLKRGATYEAPAPLNADDELLSDLVNASGGSGGSGTILQSQDETLWLIGVNDSGALQTTQVATGTPGTLHLFSPDNTQWEITVNNSGALITTAV
jgi:hypothetical protein